MANQEQHPSVEDLTAFSSRQLNLEKAVQVESHIGDCTPCCETLIGLASDDTFVGLLQEARDPVNGTTIGAANCATDAEHQTARVVLADHSRYEIEELIARGGMGEVFKAKHRMMDRTVALKVIKGEFTRNAEAVERFHREVKTAAQLSHRNIVTAFDAEQADGVHFLVMEYVDGVNLADLVKQAGQLSVGKACDYAQQAAIGMQHAHEEGMVHRDMKPHNLMLTTDGAVKILDFGLASLSSTAVRVGDSAQSDDPSLTAAGSIMGTPDFISPEQAADARKADIRSDIYSLGATLHYLLTGQPPFAEGSVAERLKHHAETTPASVSTLRDDVPEGLTDVISRMMSKDPAQRFQTPQQVADALAPFVDTYRTKVAEPASGSGKSWWPPRLLTGFAFGAFGLVLAGIIYLQTNNGTLVIDAIDDKVEVEISKASDASGDDYLKLNVVDTVTGSKVVTLPTGDYKVTLGDNSSQYELNEGGFTLSRGGDVVITVTRKASEPAEIPPLVPIEMPEMAQQKLTMNGFKLTADEAAKLEKKMAADPADLDSRLQLLGYYGRNSIMKPALRKSQAELVCWWIKNYPEAAAHKQLSMHASINPSGYLLAKKAWQKQVSSHPENTAILRNAARFFLQSDRPTATEYLLKAQEMEPDSADLAAQLGQLYQLGLMRESGKDREERAKKALEQFERAMSNNAVPQAASSMLVSVTKAAFAAGELDKAHEYAQQLLAEGGDDPTDWNSGNATHHANIVLGRLALKQGKIEEAGKYLVAAGRTSGSPQLNSFGPNMSLAKELIESGERDVVLRYFDLCSAFWKNAKLKQWTATVKGGGMPEFGGNMAY